MATGPGDSAGKDKCTDVSCRGVEEFSIQANNDALLRNINDELKGRSTTATSTKVQNITSKSGNINNSEIKGSWNKSVIFQFFRISNDQSTKRRRSQDVVLPNDAASSLNDLSPHISTVHPLADLPADTRGHLAGLLGTIPGHAGVGGDMADVADWLLDDPSRDEDAGQTLKNGPERMPELLNRLRSGDFGDALSVEVGGVNRDEKQNQHVSTLTMENTTTFKTIKEVHGDHEDPIPRILTNVDTNIVDSLRNIESSIAMGALLSSVQSEINSLEVACMLMEARLEACQDEASRMKLSDRLSSLNREIAAAKKKRLKIESNIHSRLSAAPTNPVHYPSKETTKVSSVSWLRRSTTRMRTWVTRKAASDSS